MKSATKLPKHLVVGSRGGRLIKWRGTVVSMAPGLVVALVIISSNGIGAASAETVSVVEQRNTKQDVTVNGDWIVAPTGSVDVVGSSTSTAVEFAAGAFESGYVGRFSADGLISSTAINAAGSADAKALSFRGFIGEYVKDINDEIVTTTPGSLRFGNSVSATAKGGTSDVDVSAKASGIHISGGMIAKSEISGTGQITVVAEGGQSTLSGVSVNTGVKETYAIYVDRNVEDSTITSSGNISVTAAGGTAAGASAKSDVAEVAGIWVDGRINYGAVLNNSGSMEIIANAGVVDATNDNAARAKILDVSGIWIDSGLFGESTLTNSGDISVTANAGTVLGGGDAADARLVHGIRIDSSINASRLENSGDLTVFAQGGSTNSASGPVVTSVQSIYGISVASNLERDSLLTNSGRITVVASAGNTRAASASADYVSGIDFGDTGRDGGVNDGSDVSNTGAISVIARAGEGRSAFTNWVSGIRVKNGLTGNLIGDTIDYSSLTNAGDLNVEAYGGVGTSEVDELYGVARGDADRTRGLWIEAGLFLAKLTNTGNISVTAVGGRAVAGDVFQSTAHAVASGIHLNSDINENSIYVNDGNLSVAAQGGYAKSAAVIEDITFKADELLANALAYGAFVDGIDDTSEYTNTGNVSVRATGGTAVATGVAESGEVLPRANADAEAYGLAFRDLVFGQVTNSGNVSAIATSGTGDGPIANAFGIYNGEIAASGSFTSTGNLTGRATGESGMGAGFYVNELMDGTVTLSGAIRGVGPTASRDDSYAIHFGEGDGYLDINAPTYFVGGLVIDDQNVTLTSSKSHSVHWDFDVNQGAIDLNDGSFTLVEGNGIPWFSRDGDIQSGEYATYDPTGQAMQDQTVARVAGFGDDAMRRNLAAAMAREQGSDDGEDRSAPLTWAAIIGGSNEFAGEGVATNDFDVRAVGGIAGLALDTGRDFTFGLMAGVVSTDASSDSALAQAYDIDGTSAFVGASAAANLSGLQLDAGVKLGKTNMESTRFVNYNLAIPEDGVDQAVADTDAKWAGVSFGASYDIAVNETLTVTPHANMSYTRAKLDGYAENGSTSDATVSGRSIAVTEGEVGVSISHRIASGVLRGSLGYAERAASGPTSVDVGMIGDQNTVGIESGSYGAARLGFGYSAMVGENATFDIDGSVLSGGGDFQGQQLTASFNLRF